MTQKRKRLSGPEKIAIVKRYLIERVPISDLCDEHGFQPSQIYRWQAAIFEHGADAFDLKKGRRTKAAESAKDARIAKLEAWEKQAIIDYHRRFPLEGYRRLAYMMLDQDVVAVSPTSVYRVLKAAGLLDRNRWAPSKKGKGFVQPIGPHEHWHIDISYLNIAGTFYFLCSVLDGYSRAIVHWEIRETMKEPEVETIVQRALEKHPSHEPRIISDNGPLFIAKDFKQFVRPAGITHVRTSPYYPQSNGKLERWHGTLKGEELRNKAPRDVEEARRVVGNFVTHSNKVRLHSALG